MFSTFKLGIFRAAIAAASVSILGACATQPQPVNIAQAISTSPQLSTLNTLVGQAGLRDTLAGTGPFTVFAPTNEAFAQVNAKTLEELGKDPAKLRAVLTYHVLAGQVMAADVKNGNVKTSNGAELAIAKSGAYVTVEEAMVQQADLKATNGVIHTIDRVLIPPVRR